MDKPKKNIKFIVKPKAKAEPAKKKKIKFVVKPKPKMEEKPKPKMSAEAGTTEKPKKRIKFKVVKKKKETDDDGDEKLKFVKFKVLKKYPFIPLPPLVTANENGGKKFVRILNSIRERTRKKIGHTDNIDYREGRNIFEKMDGKVLVLKSGERFDLGAISRYMRKITKMYNQQGDEVFKSSKMGNQFPSYSGIMDFYKYVGEQTNVIKLGMKNIIGQETIDIDVKKIKEKK